MSDTRFADEQRITLLARHGQSVKRRWAFAFLGLGIAAGDAWVDYFPAPWYAVVGPSLLLLALNAWCRARVRADRVVVWHFWTMLVADAVLIAWITAMAGPHGAVAIGFYVVVAAAYGLGLPRAAQVHIALTTTLYVAARVVAGAPTHAIVLETASLAMLSYLAVASPMRFTRRLRRARVALGALERGDFSQRLPTRALDDLGFLAASYNSTAEALGAVVDELRRSREALAHQAYHDPLTGLANRARFRERLRRAVDGERPERVVALMVDLDDYKTVNDRLGHAAGDRLLQIVAERLLNATRGCDTVARLGGDEFAVLLENVVDPNDAAIVAERILAALATPFEIGGTLVRVGASVGAARHGGRRDGGESLLHEADAAMYSAKARGKGRYVLLGDLPHALAG